MNRRVAGVDGWKGRWVAVFLGYGRDPLVRLFDDLRAAEAGADWKAASVIAIDIPIDLPVGGETRPADMAARTFVGPRRSSVFLAPPSAMLDASDYATARALAQSNAWKGVSAQAWALMTAIRQAADIARSDERIYEVHPEVSFCAMSGSPLLWSKRSWNGFHRRRQLLAKHGIAFSDTLTGAPGGVALDDVLDAAAAAWSARRIANGTSCRLPTTAAAEARSPVIHY